MQDTEIDTVLGEDIVFRGKLQFKKNLKINGLFRGTISTGGHIIIGPAADVEADIDTNVISVHGRMHGNINANQKIEIMKNGRVTGDIRTPDMEIQPGSRFNGNCIMD